jgi:hypothetical protein
MNEGGGWQDGHTRLWLFAGRGSATQATCSRRSSLDPLDDSSLRGHRTGPQKMDPELGREVRTSHKSTDMDKLASRAEKTSERSRLFNVGPWRRGECIYGMKMI